MAGEQPSEQHDGSAAQRAAAETPPDPPPAASLTPGPTAAASAPPATAAPSESAGAGTKQPIRQPEPVPAGVSADTPFASAGIPTGTAAQPPAAVKQERPPQTTQRPASEPLAPAPPVPFEGVPAEEEPPAEALQLQQPDTLMPAAADTAGDPDVPPTMATGLHQQGRDAELAAQQYAAVSQQLFSQLSGTASFTGAIGNGTGRGTSPPDMSGVVGSHDPAFASAQAANILKRLSSTATTGTEQLSTMGSLRNALTAGSTDFSASGLVSLGSGQVPGFDQVAFYQHLVEASQAASARQLQNAALMRPPPSHSERQQPVAPHGQLQHQQQGSAVSRPPLVGPVSEAQGSPGHHGGQGRGQQLPPAGPSFTTRRSSEAYGEASMNAWVKGEGGEGLKRLSGSLTSAPPESAPAEPISRAPTLSGVSAGGTAPSMPATTASMGAGGTMTLSGQTLSTTDGAVQEATGGAGAAPILRVRNRKRKPAPPPSTEPPASACSGGTLTDDAPPPESPSPQARGGGNGGSSGQRPAQRGRRGTATSAASGGSTGAVSEPVDKYADLDEKVPPFTAQDCVQTLPTSNESVQRSNWS